MQSSTTLILVLSLIVVGMILMKKQEGFIATGAPLMYPKLRYDVPSYLPVGSQQFTNFERNSLPTEYPPYLVGGSFAPNSVTYVTSPNVEWKINL